ncbi:2'-5' RNA ligase family protein [Nonomuraea polychroma]|uniref:2'-5' RNA ligase family protein n=1 Tax=Nonomuraea polychroma TaxID=46176 RepID=UPI000FDE80A8|nr:hypothetical protein [Nonomuraea polychroma]
MVDDQPAVRDVVRECQDKLAGVGGLDFIPAEWLHMTTQIVGFPDEIAEAERDAMIASVAKALRVLEPVTAQLGEVCWAEEAAQRGRFGTFVREIGSWCSGGCCEPGTKRRSRSL